MELFRFLARSLARFFSCNRLSPVPDEPPLISPSSPPASGDDDLRPVRRRQSTPPLQLDVRRHPLQPAPGLRLLLRASRARLLPPLPPRRPPLLPSVPRPRDERRRPPTHLRVRWHPRADLRLPSSPNPLLGSLLQWPVRRRRLPPGAKSQGPAVLEGYAVDLSRLRRLSSSCAGVFRQPAALEGGDEEAEILYMRSTYERVMWSPDSESFHLINPHGSPDQELSLFLLRSR